MAQKVYLKKSAVVDKTPAANIIEFGELAINYASGSGKSFLAHKKYDGTIAKYHEDAYNSAQFASKTELENVAESAGNAMTKANSAYTYASAVSVNLQNNYYTKTQADAAIKTAKDAAVTSAYTNAVASANSYTDSKVADIEGDIASAVEKANSAFTYAGAVSATVKSSYWTTGETQTKINEAKNAAVTSAYTAATGYASTNFFTKSSAGTMYDSLHGDIAAADNKAESAFTYASAISASVKSTFATHSEVSTASGNAITSAKNYADKTFITASSAASAYDVLHGEATAAQTAANSAFTYASAISASVKNNFATHDEVRTASGNAISSAVTSAKSYADGTFFTKASAGTMYETLNTKATNAQTAANSAFTYASAISASVKSSFATHDEVRTASGNAITSAITSAKTYANDTFFTKASAGTMYETLNTKATNAKTAADSAFTYASAISATVKANFATHSEVSTASGNAISSAITSAKSYADGTFFTKASAGTMYETLNTKATNAKTAADSAFTYASAISATVKSNFATHSEVSTASGNAITSAKNYADKTFITASSAASAYDALHGEAANAHAAANSAFTYASAISATVKNLLSNVYTYKGSVANYANLPATGKVAGYVYNVVNAQGQPGDSDYVPAGTNYAWNGSAWDALGGSIDLSDFVTDSELEDLAEEVSGLNTKLTGLSSSTISELNRLSGTIEDNEFVVSSALTDLDTRIKALSGTVGNLDGEYLTRASAGTMYETLNTKATNAQTAANSAFTYASAISATVKANFATHSEVSTASGNAISSAITSAKTYANNTFFTKASAGTMYETLNTKATNAQTAANSAFTYASAISATVKANFATHSEVSTASGNAISSAITSAKTYANNTFFTKASAGTMYETLNTKATNAQTAANSAFTYASAISATVKTNFATHGEVSTASGNAISSAVTSAKTYADATFTTKASAGTMYDTLNTKATNAQTAANSAFTYASAISATVKSTYATIQNASSYAAAALANAMDYTDSKISGELGDYVTTAVTDTLNQKLTALSSSTMAISGTVKSGYWTSATTQTKINDAKNAAVTSAYTNAVASANSYTNTNVNALSGNVETQLTNIKGDVATLKSSAATLNGKFASYMLTTDIQKTYWTSATTLARIGSASGYAYNQATAYTKTLSGNVNTQLVNIKSDIADIKSSAATWNSLSGLIAAVSATVTSDYATETEASTYAAAALGNAMAYTDSKIMEVDADAINTQISNVKTAVSAVSAYTLTSAATHNEVRTASGASIAIATNSALTAAIGTSSDASSKNTIYGAKKYADEKVNALSGNVETQLTNINGDISNLRAASGNYVTTGTAQSISGVKTFTAAPTLSAGYNAVTAASFTSSYRTVPFATTATAQTTIMYVNKDTNKGLMYNPNTGLVRAGGFVINGKAATDILNATGGTTSLTDYAASAVVKSKFTSLEEKDTNLTNSFDALSGTVKTLSGALTTVYSYKGSVTNYSNLPESGKVVGYVYNVVNAYGNIPAGTNYAWNGSAWDALGGSIDLSSYATTGYVGQVSGNIVTNLSQNITDARNAANSAFTYASAISATVKANFATNDSVRTASGNAITSAITSAKTYANNTFFTKASAGTMYETLNTKATNAQTAANSAFTYASAISATVLNFYATVANASSYAAAALANAMDYTDNKVSTVGGSYFTKASAGTMYDTLNTKATNAHTAANSAFTYASAISATVKANFATHGEVSTASGNAISSAITSAKTYANNTFFTKASAGTMYETLNTKATNAHTAANSAFTYASAISATVKANFATNASVSTASGNAITSAKTYANNTFFTKASAGTMYDNVHGDIVELSGGTKRDYMLKHSYVASGTTAGKWEVEIPGITEYFDGLTVHIRLGSSYENYKNLLNINGIGNAFVFWRKDSITTSHFPQWAELTLVYRTNATTGYTSTFNYSTDIVSGTTYKNGWVAEYAYYSDSNSRIVAVYERRYAGSRLTRYQIIGIDKDERLQPLTKVDSGTYVTGGTKPVNTVGFKPDRFFYRSTTAVTAAGGAEAASIDYENMETTSARYTFNSDLAAYRAIYLRGTYNPNENLFYLNTGLTSFYVQVPTNTANINLADYFTTGDYYIYLGATYSSTNYFQLTPYHEVFYFDGTNLVKYSKKYTDDEVQYVNTKVMSLSGVVEDNEYTTSAALNNLNAKINSLSGSVEDDYLTYDDIGLFEDTKATQEHTTEYLKRPLILGNTSVTSGASINGMSTQTVTAGTKFNKNIYAIPGRGTVGAKEFRVGDGAYIQYNDSTESIDFVFWN